jgi:sporulation protein YlmC with PRC-barrel domain
MKVFSNQSAFFAASALGLIMAVQAQQTSGDQKQPANPAQPSAVSPATTKPSQSAGGPSSSSDKQQPAASPTQVEHVSQAVGAAADRRPLLSGPESATMSERKLPGTIHASTKGTQHLTARAIAGRTVRGSDGKDVGTVKDLFIDQDSGSIAYAVVSSGGLGLRDRLHLVPFKALKSGRKYQNEYDVPMNEAEWHQLGALDETAFKSGRLTVSDGERRDLARRFERSQSGEAASGSAFYTQDISSQLIRADEIRGSDVFIGEKDIGTINEVIVDERAAVASALFDPSPRLTGAKEKFVVPLNRYSFGTVKGDRITTMLARADFEQMRNIAHEPGSVGKTPPTSPTAANSPSPTSNVAPAAQPPSPSASSTPAQAKSASTDQKNMAANQRPANEAKSPTGTSAGSTSTQPPQKNQPELTPTGRTAADQKQAAPAGDSLTAAKAIRAMLDLEAATVARIEVEVKPENGSIVLRGSVADEQLKKSIEDRAAQAAKGARIDSQIAVEKK